MSQDAVADAAVINEFKVPDNVTETEVTEEPDNEGQEPSSIEDLPDWAQEEIRRLRRENANARVKAREANRSKPAEEQPEVSRQALKAAEDRGRSAARMEYGIRLAGAEVKAALAGVLTEDQIADVLDDLNLSRFVDDEGDVDSDAVKVLRDKYTALVGKRQSPLVNHGRTSTSKAPKSTADQFAAAIGAALG